MLNCLDPREGPPLTGFWKYFFAFTFLPLWIVGTILIGWVLQEFLPEIFDQSRYGRRLSGTIAMPLAVGLCVIYYKAIQAARSTDKVPIPLVVPLLTTPLDANQVMAEFKKQLGKEDRLQILCGIGGVSGFAPMAFYEKLGIPFEFGFGLFLVMGIGSLFAYFMFRTPILCPKCRMALNDHMLTRELAKSREADCYCPFCKILLARNLS